MIVTRENISFLPKEPTMIYVIKGDPVPLARARMSYKTVYDSQKNTKLVLGITLANQHDDKPLIAGPLHLEFVFFMFTSKIKKAKLGQPHWAKPDLSNLIKLYEDVATSVLYNDDSQIASISARKVYSDDPRTELRIYKL
jgi:Holliday junction resolvase RusA-like endonuclease